MLTADLSGKTALVTGASSGLGAHFARVLAGAGAHVVIAARREDRLTALADAIRADGGAVTTARLDVTEQTSVDALAAGVAQVDILVNNAGVVHDAPALKQAEPEWDMVIDTNLKGMFAVARMIGQAMRDHGRGGTIINIASILGLRQAGGVLPYAVSKAGVIQMTKCLALEWARYGIRVNAIAPGYLETDLNRAFFASPAGQALLNRIPQRRLGQPGDLDGPLLLLASDAAAYMTGSVLAVDGGHLVSSL